jgi:hypothetical protein
MPKPTERKPRGYWPDLNNLEQELKAFAAQQGLGNTMPTKSQLAQANRYDLWNAIIRHGGLVAVAQQLDLNGAKGCRPRGYWQDFDKLKEELVAFMASHGLGDTMPTCSQLIKAQRADLLRPIVLHGGFIAVARRLGLKGG